MRATHLHHALVALLAALAAGPAAAEEWRHTGTLYIVGASMEGEAGIGSVTTDVDVGFDEILDNLEMGAMAAWRSERGPWAVAADLIYMKLEQDKDGLGPFGGTRASAESEQTIFEVDGFYALNERLSAYAGLRWWDLDTDLVVVGGGPLGETIAAGMSEDWVDPLVGLRYLMPLGENWELVAKADVGGFGIGSDFAWQATVFAGWNFTEHATLLLGFRVLDVDYEDGSGADRFLFDMTEGGPSVGVAWRF